MLNNTLRGKLSFFVILGAAFCVETIYMVDMARFFGRASATAVVAIEPA